MAEVRKTGGNAAYIRNQCFYSVYHCLITISPLLYLTELKAVQNSVHMEQEDTCICVQPKGEKNICSPRGCGEYNYCTVLFYCRYCMGMGLYI